MQDEIHFTEQEILKRARNTYLEGRASFAFSRSDSVLLVIDMQDEFVRPGWTPFWVPEATRQVPRIKNLIEHCRAREVPVIYTTFGMTHFYLDRPMTGSSMPNRYADIQPQDSTWFREGRIWHELAPLPGEIVIYKPSYGAFFDTPLETILKNMKRNTIIICGTLTNFCCGTTARQGYERGFQVVFGSDVTSTNDPIMQEPELQVLRCGFARVLTAEEIIAGL